MDQITNREVNLTNWGAGEPNGFEAENHVAYMANDIVNQRLEFHIFDFPANELRRKNVLCYLM